MYSSLMKKTLNRKDSSVSETNHDSEVNSIHDPHKRLVKVIEEQMDSQSHQTSHKEEVAPSTLDKVSLSTHSSSDNVHLEHLFLCDEEGTNLTENIQSALGDLSERHDQGQVLLQESGAVQDIIFSESAEVDLSFSVDDSFLGGSVLVRALDDSKEETDEKEDESEEAAIDPICEAEILLVTSSSPPHENCVEAYNEQCEMESLMRRLEIENQSVVDMNYVHYDSKACTDIEYDNECKVPNCSTPTIVTLGGTPSYTALAFSDKCPIVKNQELASASEGTHENVPKSSDDKSKNSAAFEYQKIGQIMAKLGSNQHQKKEANESTGDGARYFSIKDINEISVYTIYHRLVIFGKAIFVFHALYGFWTLWLKQETMIKTTVGHKDQAEHIEEAFHLAMYHLLSNNSTRNCPIDKYHDDQNKGRTSKSLALLCIVPVLYTIDWWRSQEAVKPEVGNKREQVQRLIKKDKVSPKHPSTLKRELSRLGNTNAVQASFVENVVLSNGKVGSVKRSARIRATKSTSESVEPIALFRAEHKVKTEAST